MLDRQYLLSSPYSAIRDFNTHYPAFAKQLFAHESEPLKESCGAAVAPVDIGFHPAHIQRAERMIDQRGSCPFFARHAKACLYASAF